jgi:uncharacterized membrane protein
MWASVAGALLIGTVATALWQIESLLSGAGWSLEAVSLALLAATGGLVGSLFDSLLGATVQGIYYCEHCGKETEWSVHHCGRSHSGGLLLVRGWAWLDNDLVNLVASVVGGVIAALLAVLLWR